MNEPQCCPRHPPEVPSMRFPANCGSARLLSLLLASVGSLAGSGRSADLLPDLIVREQELLDYDVVTDGDRVLLRFATSTANLGSGPVRVIGVLPVAPDGTQPVHQVVFRDDGSSYERPAGRFEHHPTHNHIHLEAWAAYRLRELLDGGGVGDVVAESGKTSFCLLDTFLHDASLPGASTVPVYRACEGSVQGISAGWADLYHRRLYGQNIDVKEVPRGTYWLEVEVDPDNHILEAEEGNNVTRIPVEIGEPVLLSEPLELEPNLGNHHSSGRVDLTVGYGRSPHLHRGHNLHFPEPQVLRLSSEGRRIAFFAAIENEDHHPRQFRAAIVPYRPSPFRWTHFETTGGVRRNATGAIRRGRHLLHLEASATGTYHSVGKKPRHHRKKARARRPGVSGLVFRVAGEGLIDRARIDLVL